MSTNNNILYSIGPLKIKLLRYKISLRWINGKICMVRGRTSILNKTKVIINKSVDVKRLREK